VFTARLDPVPYQDPWTATFSERKAALLSGNPRIAYYYARPDTSTFRYRAFNMIEALRHAEPGASASWLIADDGSRAMDVLDEIDLLVVCRALYTPHVGALIARAKSLGKRVLFDVDDLVFDDRYTHLVMETLAQPVEEESLQFWFGYIGRSGCTMRLCDGVITTNAFLAEKIRDFSGLPTWVVPNFLNEAQIELSSQILAAKQRSKWARDGQIDIGYFSGTPTHKRDFALIEPALLTLLESNPAVRVRIVGFPPQSELLAPFADRIETLPLQDFLNLQRAIADVEINVVPLQDNEFGNCKSELKYFEAAIVGTVTIATPTFTYRRVIDDGWNGRLAAAQQWDDVLREQVDAMDGARTVAERAAADALERYAPEAQASALRAALLEEYE
jgi:glycosyltransferase involved in cell wall biosynthesis